jgi:hypothetical protein
MGYVSVNWNPFAQHRVQWRADMKTVWRLGSRKSRWILWLSEPYYLRKKTCRHMLGLFIVFCKKNQCKYCMFQRRTGSYYSLGAGLCGLAEECGDVNCILADPSWVANKICRWFFIFVPISINWSRDSSVGIATSYGLDDEGSEFESR